MEKQISEKSGKILPGTAVTGRSRSFGAPGMGNNYKVKDQNALGSRKR